MVAAGHRGDGDHARRAAMARALAGWWNGPEGIGPVRAVLDRLAVEADAATVLGSMRPWLERLDWITALFGRAAAAMRADPLFEAPFRLVSHEAQDGIRLLAHPAATMTVLAMPLDRLAARKQAALGSRSILFSGRMSLLRVVRSGAAVLDLWRNDAERPCLSADTAGRCRPAGRIALEDGMVLAFDGSRETWTIAAAAADIVLLQAVARRDAAPLMLEYDAADGAFLAAAMNDAAAARMQLAAGLLRRMGRTDAAAAIAGSIAGSPFHLRWQLMRELLALDAAAARPLLRRLAADDPHGEIRAAARRTLALIAA